MNKLTKILDNKKREIEVLHESYQPNIEAMQKPRPSFKKSLEFQKTLAVIAEIKRHSPSEGDLNKDIDPVSLALIYEKSGASAISILTDKKFFGGSMKFLSDVTKKTAIPVLCKEFILDPFQIDLARENGASAILLISDILDDHTLVSLYHYARDMELDVLLEAHEPLNIERSVELGAPIIGINNRNLKTFEIDLKYSAKYIDLIPESRVRLSLSAVHTREDATFLADTGFDGILVGSGLMRSKNPARSLAALTNIPSRHI